MSEDEELIRRAMRAHEHEAPNVDDLRDHEFLPAPRQMHAPRRAIRWVAVAAAAACVLALVGVLVAMNDGGGRQQVAAAGPSADTTRSASSRPLSCPKSYKISWSYSVPQQPTGVDGKDRLVPTEVPGRAVVCGYSDGVTLSKSVALRGDLSIVPSTFSWIPRTLTHSWPCTADLRATDTANFLFGISYPDGTLWVSAPGSHCSGASNGKFAVMANLGTYARAAISSGSWSAPAPDTVNGCPGPIDTPGSGRLGQENKLAPPGATSVQVCEFRGSSASKTVLGPVSNGTQAQALAAALNTPSAKPSNFRSECAGGGDAATTYVVTFAYPVGPPVHITVRPGCSPAIDNGSLQAGTTDTVLPLITTLLKGR